MSSKLGTILADFTTSLATDIAIGGTAATLSTATDDDAVALPSGRYFFTLDGDNSAKEHISCDLVGTALTNIKSLSRQGVETTGCVRKHRIGTVVSLTDFGHIKFINDLVSGATNLNSEAPLGYDGAPASLSGNQLATVTYVLGVVNGGTVTFDQQIISNQTSGEALAINDVVYFKESDARWYKVDADLTATFDGLQMGINKTTAAGASVTIQVAISGPVSGFSGLTPGSKYYASNTAGAITTTPGTYSVFVGWALTATVLLFTPFVKTLPTQKEKDALVGSTGVPSSTNKYITQDNTSSDSTDQTQTTQNATVEFGEADATGRKNKIVQSFIPTKTKISSVNLYKSADTGTFVGTVSIALKADSGGSPTGADLASYTFSNREWENLAVGEFEAIFSSEYTSLVAGSLYWIVATTSTSDNSNHPNLGTNSAGGYGSGSVKYQNTTDGYVAIATIDLYFKTNEGVTSQVVKTNSSGKIEREFYSTSEMPIPAFYQAVGVLDATTQAIVCGCSTQDGSILWTYGGSSTGELVKYVRDSITGMYSAKLSVDIGSAAPTTIVILGSYIYAFYDNGANFGCNRYDLADGTNETAMTLLTSITATGASSKSWTDGKYIYFVAFDTDTTVRTLSISGTNITQVTTATLDSTLDNSISVSTMFDGKNVYHAMRIDATDTNLYKLSDSNGASAPTSTTAIVISKYSDTDTVVPIPVNIDDTRMYLVKAAPIYDETAQVVNMLHFIPISKP
jgi:hypothetical protein